MSDQFEKVWGGADLLRPLDEPAEVCTNRGCRGERATGKQQCADCLVRRRDRRVERAARGLCTRCGEKARRGKKTCVSCAKQAGEVARRSVLKRRSEIGADICPQCLKLRKDPGRAACRRCLLRGARYSQRSKGKLKAQRRCVRCRKASTTTKPGSVHCQACLDALTVQRTEKARRRVAARECTACGEPLDESRRNRKLCAWCASAK